MIYIVAFMMTFIEALCCRIFCDTFFAQKTAQKKWVRHLLFWVLYIGFIGIALFPQQRYLLKAIAAVLLISIIAYIQYRNSLLQTLFVSISYYSLLICFDRVMLIVLEALLGGRFEQFLNDWANATLAGLLIKAVLFLIIMILSRIFRTQGSLVFINGRQWVGFLFFPIITIVCMTIFAVQERGVDVAVLTAAFALVFSNFLVFYIIRDVVSREKDIQNIRVSQERAKSRMDMYQYMENVYETQRKKTHDFKNNLTCLYGLLKAGQHEEATAYIEKINHNWSEEIDYLNTNNAIVNSILNQKFLQAKNKGISILFSVNDLGKVSIQDEDMVTLLANLLDNAIEACEKIAEGTKVIKFRFLDEEDKIIISVRNPVAEPLELSGDIPVTTKEDRESHGIGMVNIQEVVNKYGGESIWSCNDGFFTYSIEIERESSL